MDILIPSRPRNIVADINLPKSNTPVPLVVFCHGYKGYKDWGAWNLFSKEVVRHEMACLKFNFSHNGGTEENPIDFPDLEAFGRNTYSQELSDLNVVFDWVEENLQGQVAMDQIYLIGHSRGGGMVTLFTGQDSRVAKLVTWAAVSDYGSRFPAGDELKDWKEKGVRFIKNGRTCQDMPHYFSFYEDYIQNEKNLNIQNWAAKIDVPTLVVHGSDDLAVNVSEGEKLNNTIMDSQILILEGAGHTFGTSHPWTVNDFPENFTRVVTESITFLKA